MRLRNESGVFECISNVDIDGPPENKLKKLEEQKKKEKEEEEMRKQEEEEERRKEEEALLNCVNKNISELKSDGKEEDRDSGLKIGEESATGSDYEYEYTDNDYDDSYEDEGFDVDNNNNINNNNENVILEYSVEETETELIENSVSLEKSENEYIMTNQEDIDPIIADDGGDTAVLVNGDIGADSPQKFTSDLTYSLSEETLLHELKKKTHF